MGLLLADSQNLNADIWVELGLAGDLAAAAGPGRGLALVGGVAAVAALTQAALSCRPRR
jgi:hypothetical protein